MKKLIRIINDWYKESNRDKHCYAGGIIFAAFLVFGIALGIAIIPNAIIATGATLATMMSAEYKDKEYGNLFDWKVILAGMTIPVLFDIISFTIYIIL